MKKIFTFILIAACTFSFAQKSKKDKNAKGNDKVVNKAYQTASGLKYTFSVIGAGAKVENGDMVTVHYTGKFLNDTVFDSSVSRNQPFTFKVGAKQVIAGWDEALQLMNVGDKAKLTIPPSIGYGEQAIGPIPANSTLVFEIEVLSVKPGIRPFDVSKKDTIKLPSGLKYVVVKEGTGYQPKIGDMVTIDFSAYFLDGKMFDSSIERQQPYSYNIGRWIKGMDEGISFMKKGGKARLIIPSALAFGEQGIQNLIPPNTDIVVDVDLLEAKPKPVAVPYNVTGLDTLTTPSGLKYIIVNKGNGARPNSGNIVSVHYTGYLLDGKIFDSSIERDQPIQFPLGQGQVIKGWDEAIGIMNVGTKMRIIIPPHLGYGAAGSPPVIPANAVLVFDVELVGIGNPENKVNDGHDHSDPNHKH